MIVCCDDASEFSTLCQEEFIDMDAKKTQAKQAYIKPELTRQGSLKDVTHSVQSPPP